MRQPGLVRNSKQRLVQANTHKATNSHQVGGNQKLYQQSRIFLVGFVALRPKSTAMVIAGRSVHLTTLFPGQA